MKFYFLFLFLLLHLSFYAQNSFDENVVAPLQKDFIFFEKIFVHTNKTTYSLDDTIWFKVYVGGRNNIPSNATTRLHVNLLDAKGEMISAKNIFIYEGTGKGQFELNSTVAPGTYYLQAYTNNMLNFGDKNYFLQEINISGIRNIRNNSKENYEFKVLPEGGSFLEGTENVVGIKSLNGEGIDFSGKIVNSKNEEIIDFENQHMDMAKTSFFYESGEEYKVIINISGKTIKIEIPAAKSQGIVLSLDNSKKDTLSLSLRTNKNTADSFKNTNYTLLYHQRNKVIGYLEISKLDSLTALINSDKSVFYEGVNTITLFKGCQPVAQRKFYIDDRKQEVEISLRLVNTKKDSLTYKISLENRNEPLQANLSISVLSGDIENFKVPQNIKSAFLFSPYIQHFVEDPARFFYEENKERKEHLDLLLLNQKTTSSSLEEMIEKLNPRPKLNFEFGFELEGELVPPFYSNNLALISNKNILIDTIFLNGNKKFIFEKLLLYKGDTVKIAFLNNEGTAIKPKGIHFDPVVSSSPPKIEISYNKFEAEDKNVSGKTEKFEFSQDAIKLNEVLLTGKGRDERSLRRRKLIEKYGHIVFDIGKYYGLRLPKSYKGFNSNLMWYLRFDQQVTLKNWKGREYYLGIPGGEAIVYINGERQVNMDLLRLTSIDMEDVENIMIKPGQHSNVYQVFTTEDFKNNVERLAVEHVVENGYDRPKEYYSPQPDFDKSEDNRLIEIDWKPEVTTNKKGEAFITINKKQNSKELIFSIQGFSKEGLLISDTLIK